MVRLEFTEGTSQKFWEIMQTGADIHIAWGRLGTAGQSQLKSLGNAADASTFMQQQIQAKQKKGYQIVAVTEAPLLPPRENAAPSSEPPSPKKTATPPLLPRSSAGEPILWTPALRKKHLVFSYWAADYPPRVDPLPPATSAESAWNRLSPELRKANQNLQWSGDEAWQELGKRFRQWLQGEAPQQVPAEFAPLILALSQKRESIDLLWEKRGPKDTLTAWINSRYLSVRQEFERSRGYVTFFTQDQTPVPPTYYEIKQKWLALREAIQNLEPGDEQTLMNDLNLQRTELALAGRMALDWVCWHQHAWIQADAAEWLALPPSPQAPLWESGWLLWPLLTEPEMLSHVSQLFTNLKKEFNTLKESLSEAYEIQVYWLLDRAGQSAAQTMVTWITEGKRAGLRKKAASALAMITSPEALQLMAGLLAHKDGTVPSHEALSRDPQAGCQALLHVLGRKRNYVQGEQLLASLWRSCSNEQQQALRQAFGERVPQSPQTTTAATAQDVPAYFANPPWQQPSLIFPQMVLTLPDGPSVMDWTTYRSEENRPLVPYIYEKPPLSDKRDAEMLERFSGFDYLMLHHLDWLSQPAALALWNQQNAKTWNPYDKDPWEAIHLAKRFGPEGLPGFLRFIATFPNAGYQALMYYDSPQAVPAMINGLARLEYRTNCRKWFLQHPANALRGLIPLLLNPTWKLQHEAYRIFRWLLTQTNDTVVNPVLLEYAAEIQTSLQALQQADPLRILPEKMPKLPAFWKPEMLPPVQLQSGEQLPAEALTTIALSLKLSQPGMAYPGIAVIQQLCTATSLEAFALSVWELWLGAGAPGKEEWAFWSLAAFGQDEACRQLTPRLEKWPGERAAPRAMLGLDILFAMSGADNAWPELHRLSLKTKYPSVQEKAKQLLAEMASNTPGGMAQLGDRLVPPLGLNPTHTRTFDLGQHSATVHLLSSGAWEWWDHQGKILPKAPAKGEAAGLKTLKQFTKDLGQAVELQSNRLEQAMISGRRWSPEHFHKWLVTHPLVGALVKGLVWGSYDDQGQLLTLFRLNAAGQARDLQDLPLALENTQMGLPHPLEFMAQRDAWLNHFTALKLPQPLAQLQRETWFLPPHYLNAEEMPDWRGVTVKSKAIRALISQKGWQAPRNDEGVLQKQIGRGFTAEMSLELAIWALGEYDENVVYQVVVRQAPHYQALKLGTVPPLVLSEIHRDLSVLQST